jgi:hypothetical protein
MWALHGIGELSQHDVDGALGDADPYVRGWAIQLMMQDATVRAADRAVRRASGVAGHAAAQVDSWGTSSSRLDPIRLSCGYT